MRTICILVAVAGVLLGCSKDQPKPTTPDQPAAVPSDNAPASTAPPDVSQNQKVSPNVSVSADIAAACGLKVAPSDATPKFEYDKDELTAPDRAVLDQIAACLMTGALKGRAITLVGRADPRGTEEYNLGLGSRRSDSVKGYLGRLGVATTQMAATTRGALDATGNDEATWAQDRRVDIILQP